ncbi:aldo/keto reductase [Peniophora sp. CONT]|nr:aldo/keto reductase [Peniophora sp. CONT]
MVQTVNLGGSAKEVNVSRVGMGLGMLTSLGPDGPSEEQAFEVIKASVDAVPAGSKMLLNSAQFYGPKQGTENLEMLARFFERHPGYADKVFLCVKGGTKPNTFHIDTSPEGLRASVELCNSALRGTKTIDLFQIARVVRSTPLSEQMKILQGFVQEGLIGHIGLSESSEKSVREYNEHAPIAAVEIEVSPWSYEDETKNVISACAELGIAIIAYSPLGHGFLTGQMGKLDDKDWRNNLSRFKGEHATNNLKLVEALKKVAENKGISPAQLCLAWVQSLGERIIPIPCSTKTSRMVENVNTSDIKLTDDEHAQIERILEEYPVSGGRYFDAAAFELHLWG